MEKAPREDVPKEAASDERPRLAVGLYGITDTIRELSNLGLAKTKVNPAQGILLGWQAMAYLGFAAFLAWMLTAAISPEVLPGLAKFIVFLVFGASALVIVILFGSTLVTGDYMTAGLSLMTGQAKWREVLWEWSITHSGHWISGFVISWLIIVGAGQAGAIGSEFMGLLASIGETKVNDLTWEQLFYRGIFANWLVAMGVWGAFRTKETIAKVFMIGVPVGTFFAIGFEHSIVNHFALAAGIWAGAEYTWGEAWFKNLVPVTLGNIIGAMIFQGMVYWYASGMQKWTGPGKWRRPHGTYSDLARAFRDTTTLMFFFVGMAPLMVGGMLVFAIEPMLGIEPGSNDPNWGMPVLIAVYLVATALILKWAFMPRRRWYQIPED